ncbi:MAG: hypothetical protein KZQ65_08965, partial [Candidatus Thiodiazotropha sp. (ex Gloverina cf. vestifex)]|nr:hypothetical protein [Candidatus Thiodiazotropha sp. (ex Gloverina cf. vestifex)]
FASWGLYNDWPRMCTIIPQSMDSFRASLTNCHDLDKYCIETRQNDRDLAEFTYFPTANTIRGKYIFEAWL